MICYHIPILYYLKRPAGRTKSLKISTNKIYAGVHWGQRQSIKERVLDTAKRFCYPIQKIESYPVEIVYRFVFRSRPLDTLNCAYMSKMFEDALCALEVIKDDSPQYVARTVIEVIAVPKSKVKKEINDMGKKKRSKIEDWLEITIKSL